MDVIITFALAYCKGGEVRRRRAEELAKSCLASYIGACQSEQSPNILVPFSKLDEIHGRWRFRVTIPTIYLQTFQRVSEEFFQGRKEKGLVRIYSITTKPTSRVPSSPTVA
jgi:hypothetical protein